MPTSEATIFTHGFLEAALPVPARKTFTYRLPDDSSKIIRRGSRVLVPFGKRTLTGYVVRTMERPDDDIGLDESEIRSVISVPDDRPLIADDVFDLAQWAADYYLMPLGEMLKAALPTGIDQKLEEVVEITDAGRSLLGDAGRHRALKYRLLEELADDRSAAFTSLADVFGRASARRAVNELEKDGLVRKSGRVIEPQIKPKMRKAVRLVRSETAGDTLTEAQHRTLQSLTEIGGEAFFTELLSSANVSASAIGSLEKKGIVEVFTREMLRDPIAEGETAGRPDIVLNSEQDTALSAICGAFDRGKFEAFLLHGVTGSGKTEVYIRAMAYALQHGRSALMLVPEIALTPIFSRRLRRVFGRNVAILHSNLSAGERFDEWRRIRSGEARIAIGTRSAVFAPLDDIGLIIVDEEHDPSYRQNEMPFYSGRDTAVMRANLNNAVVVLGSATPSMETFQNARTGKYSYLRLTQRIGGRPLAAAELIDMREVFRKTGKDIVLSTPLTEAITETHRRGHQSIILLNRRGYSPFVMCRSCGERLKCRNCDVTMTYHKAKRRLICHYCSYSANVPDVCPFCQSEYLYFIGEGTEKVEEMLREKFPQLVIARVDRDTMKKKGRLDEILLDFDRGNIDLLVGTQMLAKGHDFPNVTLVGVISVDIGLGLPDIRSAERTFQLLTQVAGRAGRGDARGRVLIQTYYPEHYALRFAVEQDYEGFFEHEIRFRERMQYPPLFAMALISIAHRDASVAERTGRILRSAFERHADKEESRILGPAPSSISKLKGEYRFQLIIKSTKRPALRALIENALADAGTAGAEMRSVKVEIDPTDLV